MIKLLSWNVNGIRSARKQGFLEWFEDQQADVVCVQEARARPDQLDERLLHPLDYHSYWSTSEKPG